MIKDRILAWIGGGASLALAAALAWVMISNGAEVRALTVANSNLANDLSQSRINAARLEGSLAAQSAAIATLAAAGAQRELRLANAMADAIAILQLCELSSLHRLIKVGEISQVLHSPAWQGYARLIAIGPAME